jgi:hypothetical protein
MMNKRTLSLITVLFYLSIGLVAESKDILQKIPADYDYVFCLRFSKLFANDAIMKKMNSNKELVAARKKLEEKIGLKQEDLQSIYVAGVAAQYQKIKSIKSVDKLDTVIFVELTKELNVEKLQESFSQTFSGSKTVNGVRCVQFNAGSMKDAYLAFLSPKLLMLCPDKNLLELVNITKEDSMLANPQAERLLRTNGFGGILSLVHWGQIGEVHPMTPWMKNYTGGTINLYYEEAKDLELECTLTFNDLASVKSASLLIGMGLSFLDFKPELAQFKQLIDFKVYEKNLLVDVKVSTGMFANIENLFKKMGRRR